MLFLIGGFGFVGCNILKELERQDNLNDVIVVDDFSNASEEWNEFNVKYISGDYSDPEVVNKIKAMKVSHSKFILLAGETRVVESSERPIDFLNSNIVKPASLVFDVLQADDELILISTAGAIFNGEMTISKNLTPSPKNFYGTSKYAEELVLNSLCELKKVSFKIVRFTNVYGFFSDKKKSAIHEFCRRAIKSKEIVVNGDGDQRRDFIFASDVAESLVRVVLAKEQGSHIFASTKSYSINEILQILKSRFPELRVIYRKNEKLIKTEPRNVEVAKGAMSIYFRASVNLEEGINKLIDEFSNVS